MSQIWFNAIRAGDIAFVRANATKYRGTRNKHNETGLVYAIKHNRVDIASFLIPYERNLILDGAFTPLMVCALYNCVDVATILAASGHSAVNSEMQTALMIAAERDHAKIIRIILPNEVMRRDSRDRTALMLASISGQNKAVELLLSQEGGFVNSHKETAFYLALYHNNLSTAKILEPVEANTWCDKLVSVVGMCLSDPKTTEYIQYLAHKYPNMEKAYKEFCGQAGASALGSYRELKSIADLRPSTSRRTGVLSPLDIRTNKTLFISPIPGIASSPRSSRSVNPRLKEERSVISQSIQNSANELEKFKDSYITNINQLRRDAESLQKQLEAQAPHQPQDPPRASTSAPRYQKTPTILRQPAVTPTSFPETTSKDAHIVHSFTSSPPRAKRTGGDVTTLCNEIIVSFVKSMGANPSSPRSPSKPTRSNSTLRARNPWDTNLDVAPPCVEQAVSTTDTSNSFTNSKTANAYVNYNKQMQSKLLAMFNQKRDRSLGWNSTDSSFFSQSTGNKEKEDYRANMDDPDGLASILTRSVPIPAQILHSPKDFEIVYDQVLDNHDSEHLNIKIPLIDNDTHVYNSALINSAPFRETTQSPKNVTSIFMGANSIIQQQPQPEQPEQPTNAPSTDTNQGLMDTIENFTQIIDDLSNENILLNKELDKFRRMQRQLYDESKTDKQTIESLRKQLDSMAHNFSEATKRDIYTMKKEIARLDNSLMDAKRLELELSRVVDDDDGDQITDESLML